MGLTVDDGGFDELEAQLREYAARVERDELQRVLKAGGDEYVKDLLALPKPMSALNSAGHTHLVRTFTDKNDSDGSVIVGWGKHYGLFLEKGTRKMAAQPHMRPTWDSNAERYYRTMSENFHRGI